MDCIDHSPQGSVPQDEEPIPAANLHGKYVSKKKKIIISWHSDTLLKQLTLIFFSGIWFDFSNRTQTPRVFLFFQDWLFTSSTATEDWCYLSLLQLQIAQTFSCSTVGQACSDSANKERRNSHKGTAEKARTMKNFIRKPAWANTKDKESK